MKRVDGEWIVSVCVDPTMKPAGGGVMVRGCLAGDTECYFKFKSHLTSIAVKQRCAIPSGLCSVAPSLVFKRTTNPNTPPDYVRTVVPRRKVMECCMRCLHNDSA